MSIATAITDFKNRISAIYDILEQNNAEMPEKKNTSNLPSTIETVQTSLDSNKKYTMIKYSNDVKSFYLIEEELDIDTIPNLSDAVEVKLGTNITDIAFNVFNVCASLTSVTILNKTWQDAIDNSYWGISDPNIIHGDWDKYLSFANAQDVTSTVKLSAVGSAPTINLLSSSNGVDWGSYDLSSDIELTSYDRVFLKANATNKRFGSSNTSYWQFVMTGTIAANGNINSLLNGENPDSVQTIQANCYRNLFQNCSSLITAPDLPSTTLGMNCYNRMFENCTSLTASPELPATVLDENCYFHMFFNCSSLIYAPKILPATTLSSSCYYQMFRECISLINAPKLPAIILTSNCYYQMFYNCYNLSKLVVAFTEWNPSNATTDWVTNAGKNVSETTFICPNQLDVSTRSNNTIPTDTETHTWNIQPTRLI